MTTFTDKFNTKKGFGLVVEVFNEANMARLRGNLGVGHVRYPTVGGNGEEDAQPFHHTFPIGVAMVHNGNVSNFHELTETRFKDKGIRLNSGCDLEVILWVFQEGLAERLATKGKLDADDIFHAVRKVHDEATRLAMQGYDILLIGHEGHVEVEGRKGEAPDRIRVVETVADAAVIEVADAFASDPVLAGAPTGSDAGVPRPGWAVLGECGGGENEEGW